MTSATAGVMACVVMACVVMASINMAYIDVGDADTDACIEAACEVGRASATLPPQRVYWPWSRLLTPFFCSFCMHTPDVDVGRRLLH